jgi:hypothetical protein
MTHYEALANRLLPDMERMRDKDQSLTAPIVRKFWKRSLAKNVLQVALQNMPTAYLERYGGELSNHEREAWKAQTKSDYKEQFGSLIAMLILGALVNYAMRALLDWWLKDAPAIKEARLELLG